MFENRALRRIFGPNRDEVTGEWKALHNKEPNDLYFLPNIFRVNKSRRIRWAGHVASMGRGEVYTGIWCGGLRERDHLKDPGVDGRIILRWIFMKWNGGMDWIDQPQDMDSWRAVVNAVMNLRVP